MTTVTLPPQPRAVPALEVAPTAIEACGAQLLAASAQIDDLGSFAADRARLTDWTGDAARAYRSDVQPLGRRADAMSLALRGVARRVQSHADTMTELARTHDDLDGQRRLLLDRIAVLREQAAVATEGDAAGLQTEAEVLTQRVETFEHQVDGFVRSIEVEEAAMRSAFDRVLTIDRIENRYAGRADPADAALGRQPPPGSPPAEVYGWWRSLSEIQRNAIMAASPGEIGNLAGIPAEARSAANTVALDRDLADWGSLDPAQLSDEEKRWLENARAADEARQRIAGQRDPVTDEPLVPQIYLYDPTAFDGDGAVAMAVGDLDGADNVAVVVPGFGTDAESAGFMADRVGRMHEASRVLDPTQSNATMFWIGYDAPDNLPWDEGWDAAGVVSEQMAERGGERLSDTIDGLRGIRADDPAHLTVVGHSYGSTTTGTALGGEGLEVDDAILVGSPGLGGDNHHASDLGLDEGHVWIGANSRDPIADLGNEGWADLGVLGGLGLGENPAEDDFGAIRFEAESEHGPNPFDDHSKYFDHNSESLENISNIINGNYDVVEQAEPLHDPWWGGVQDPEADRAVHPLTETRTTR